MNIMKSLISVGGGGHIKSLKDYSVVSKKTKFDANNIERLLSFTLAEVLITLLIIGIVAALTIPTLIHKMQMVERKAQLEKAYALLSNAVSAYKAESGIADMKNILVWDVGKSRRDSTLAVLAPYIKNLVDCDEPPLKAECNYKTYETNNGYKSFNGNVIGGTRERLGEYVMLSNGQMYFGREWVEQWYQPPFSFVGFFVDVNGAKEPNRFGHDVFAFIVNSDGSVAPLNNKRSTANGCSLDDSPWNGVGCTHDALNNPDYWKNPILK